MMTLHSPIPEHTYSPHYPSGSVATPDSSSGGGGPHSPSTAAQNDAANALPLVAGSPPQSAPGAPGSIDLAALFAEGPNPSLIVFDLDFTIWVRPLTRLRAPRSVLHVAAPAPLLPPSHTPTPLPLRAPQPFDCDKDVIAPFSVSPYGGVHDRYGRPSNAFCDVPALISALVDAGIPIAYASRNPSAGPVEALLRCIAIPPPKSQPHVRTLWDALPSRALYHAYSSAGYGRGKARHFAAIRSACGVAYKDMLFFDDLHDNIVHAQAQGTTSVHLGRRGLTNEAMAAGIRGWRERAAAGKARDAEKDEMAP